MRNIYIIFQVLIFIVSVIPCMAESDENSVKTVEGLNILKDLISQAKTVEDYRTDVLYSISQPDRETKEKVYKGSVSYKKPGFFQQYLKINCKVELECSIDINYTSMLDNKLINEDLRRSLEMEGIPLSKNAFIETQEKGSQWLIKDEIQQYIIVKKQYQPSLLSIYKVSDLSEQWISNGQSFWFIYDYYYKPLFNQELEKEYLKQSDTFPINTPIIIKRGEDEYLVIKEKKESKETIRFSSVLRMRPYWVDYSWLKNENKTRVMGDISLKMFLNSEEFIKYLIFYQNDPAKFEWKLSKIGQDVTRVDISGPRALFTNESIESYVEFYSTTFLLKEVCVTRLRGGKLYESEKWVYQNGKYNSGIQENEFKADPNKDDIEDITEITPATLLRFNSIFPGVPKSMIENVMNDNILGKEAEDFTLLDRNKKEVTLSSFQGKVILLYFIYIKNNIEESANWCSGWVNEIFNSIKSDKFLVIGVLSVERISTEELNAFWKEVDKRQLKHIFLSNNPSGEYGHVPKMYMRISYGPRIYIIDKNRKIQKFLADRPNIEGKIIEMQPTPSEIQALITKLLESDTK